MPTIDIVVRRRQDDYQAFLADNEGVWDCGRSAAEAVGKLVYSARTLLSISIAEEKREEAPRPLRAKRLNKAALNKAIRTLCLSSDKIGAIKLVRENRVIGLREAVQYVDKVMKVQR
jgi:ribosomal protein L7/L12